jgi:flavin reductase (DIM6/NTAB) family NADH-FMN oxidoreductase RutF
MYGEYKVKNVINDIKAWFQCTVTHRMQSTVINVALVEGSVLSVSHAEHLTGMDRQTYVFQ